VTIIRSKATPPANLLEAIERDMARGTAALPILPKGAREALRLAKKADVDMNEIVEVIEGDPALTARLLAVANSAIYNRGFAMTSVRRAVVRLGLQATRDILFQAVYAAVLYDVPGFRSRVEATFVHGIVTSRVARRLAQIVGIDEDAAFLAGLLHDVGKGRIYKIASKIGRTDSEDREVHDAVAALHTRSAADLCRAWRLAPEIIEAVGWHHDPKNSKLAQLVAAADVTARRVELSPRASDEDVDAILAVIGVEADFRDAIITYAADATAHAGEPTSVATSGMPPSSDTP
jgi:putative nucleotidyltransferase with HDIG domain